MLKNFTILIFVLFAAAASASAQNADGGTADAAAIRANVEQLARGWNAKSGAEFAKPFAEDADYVVINGMQIKSRAEIAKTHQGVFETHLKNTNLTLSTDSIRFLRPDVALVHVSASMKLTEGDSSRPPNAKITMVMTRTNGKWEIAAFQNTQVQNVTETKK